MRPRSHSRRTDSRSIGARALVARLIVSSLIAAVTVVSLAACEEAGDPTYAVSEQPIYYGSREPQTLALTDGEKLAIGWLYWSGNPSANFCTGTIVAPRVVATARHCLEGVGSANYVGFGVGLYPSSPRGTFRVAAMHLHPSVDAALLVLAEDATSRVPELRPIPVNRTSPSNLRGQQVDGAGYGQTHDNSTGRYFAAVWLERVDGSYLQVDGRGEQGLCFGDSGGPLLGPGPVLLGVESGGDQSCVDEDQMTRIDPITDWVDAIAGGDTPPDPCDGLDYQGRCDGTVAEWCENGQVRQYDCAREDKGCGWVDDQTGWYCVDGSTQPDACGDLTYLGRCAGTVSEWCEDGEVRRKDCADDGFACAWVDDQVGWYCVERAGGCGDVPEKGRCEGGVAMWCAAGDVVTRDCTAERLACRWVADQQRYGCVPADAVPDTCDDVDANGRCDGDLLVWCGDGEVRRRDCTGSGLVCVALRDGSHACVDPEPDCAAADAHCDGDVAVRCENGAIVRDACAARGTVCVHEPPAPPRCELGTVTPPTDPPTDPPTSPPTGDTTQPETTPSTDPPGGAAAPADDPGPAAEDSAGSGCATGGAAAPTPWPALLVPLALLVLRRRRRQAPD